MQTEQGVSFGPYQLAGPHGPLLRKSLLVRLPPKAMAVLWVLVSRAGQIVSKEELFTTVWPETVVGEETLTAFIGILRRALKDDSRQPRYITTVHRVGYRFIGQVVSRQQSGVRGEEDQQRAKSREQSVKLNPSSPASNPQPRVPVLVGREAELTQLHSLFAKALNGERQVVFVTGEAGIGKTSLVDAFVQSLASRIQSWDEERQRAKGKGQKTKVVDPWPLPLASCVAWGQCIEQYGSGEAYLPVLEALGRLGHEPRGKRVLAILEQCAPTWLAQLPSLLSPAELEAVHRRIQGATRERMLREIVEALDVLSLEHPVILVLEDLHWSDPSTVELLAMLARRREVARLLVLGTYRPIELVVTNHPLKAVKQELVARRQGSEILLGGLKREAVQTYITQRLGRVAASEELAAFIHQRTEGQPLFMAQVTDYFARPEGLTTQSVADLTAAKQALPHGLRELIEAQLGRLSEDEQSVLAVGSVGGAEFTVASTAAGMTRMEPEIEELCERLARRGQFIEERGIRAWPDGTVSACYAFRHALYQEVLYTRIPEARRMRLHRMLGERLEGGYDERASEIAAELAVHFERGRDYQRAVHYRRQAGENALRRSAHREAISHLRQGLELIESLPDTPERSRLELTFQMALGPALIATAGYAAPTVARTYTRARELCQQGGEAPLLFRALFGLWAFYIVRAEHRTAQTLAKQLLDLAESQQDSALFVEAHWAVAASAFALGEMSTAQTHFTQSIARYAPAEHHSLAFLYGYDPKMSSRTVGAWALWILGYPEQALTSSQDAITFAQALSHPFSLAYAVGHAARLHQFRREPLAIQERTQMAIALSTEQGFRFYLTQGAIFLGVASVEQGRKQEGIEQIQQGVADFRATGAELYRPYFLGLLAEAYGKVAQAGEGLALLTEALAVVERTDERFYEAELWRLKGELTLQQFKV